MATLLEESDHFKMKTSNDWPGQKSVWADTAPNQAHFIFPIWLNITPMAIQGMGKTMQKS